VSSAYNNPGMPSSTHALMQSLLNFLYSSNSARLKYSPASDGQLILTETRA